MPPFPRRARVRCELYEVLTVTAMDSVPCKMIIPVQYFVTPVAHATGSPGVRHPSEPNPLATAI
jgi:hypothetical protein